MTTRVLSIAIEDQSDGRKRTVQRKFPADAFGAMTDEVAGQGFLAIVASMNRELDGTPVVAKPEPAAPRETDPAPAPEPAPAPIPEKLPGAFAPGKKFSNTTPPKKNPVAKV